MQIIRGEPVFQAEQFDNVRILFQKAVAKYPEHDAFIYREQAGGEVIKKTFRDLEKDIHAMQMALADLGLCDERVAIIGENSYPWALTHISLLAGIGVSVPLDRLLPPDEILSLLERAEVSAVFFDASYLKTIQTAQKQFPFIKTFICMNGHRCSKEQAEALADSYLTFPKGTFYHFAALLKDGQQLLENGDTTVLRREIDSDKMVSLIFTSGTTSVAKGVMLSTRNLMSNVYGIGQVEYFPSGSRMLSILSMHHAFESTCGLLFAMSIGICCCICDGLRYIQKNLEEYNITLIVGVPVIFESFYKKIQAGLIKEGKLETVERLILVAGFLKKIGIDLRRVIFKKVLAFFGESFRYGICGAAPIDPKIIQFLNGIGIEVYQGYGLTETSPVVAACNHKYLVPSTVGKPMGNLTVAIDNNADGEEGEILVRGESVMLGYYANEAATAEVIDADGWFHTGDVGRIEKKSGCISITGRIKSMIVLKNGKKVFPEELEYCLSRCRYILDSLVFGYTEPDGEIIVSAKIIIDREAFAATGASEIDLPKILADHVKQTNKTIPQYKGVRQFVYSFVPLEKTTTLKVKRSLESERIERFFRTRKEAGTFENGGCVQS